MNDTQQITAFILAIGFGCAQVSIYLCLNRIANELRKLRKGEKD